MPIFLAKVEAVSMTLSMTTLVSLTLFYPIVQEPQQLGVFGFVTVHIWVE